MLKKSLSRIKNAKKRCLFSIIMLCWVLSFKPKF